MKEFWRKLTKNTDKFRSPWRKLHVMNINLKVMLRKKEAWYRSEIERMKKERNGS